MPDEDLVESRLVAGTDTRQQFSRIGRVVVHAGPSIC